MTYVDEQETDLRDAHRVAVLRAYLEPLLEAERLRPDVTAEEAADWLARMILSFIVGQGSWDLGDRASVHRLVNEQLLAGILAPEPDSEGS